MGVLLDHDAFLNQLTRSLNRSKDKTSVFITMKRCNGLPAKSEKQKSDDIDNKCLVRAVIGKVKISTLVTMEDQGRFQVQFANIMKVQMDALKKKEKKKEAR